MALPAAAMSAPAPAVVLQAPSSAADPTRTSKVRDIIASRLRIVRSSASNTKDRLALLECLIYTSDYGVPLTWISVVETCFGDDLIIPNS